MPRKESLSSFSASAKHLFRHLYDARALARNPLVRRFFKGTPSSDLERVRVERTALERIHCLLRRAAERIRDEDIAAGESLHAFRQYTIVSRQIFEQHAIRDVAGALGISHQHCYRERFAICMRLARYIAECDDAAAPGSPYPVRFDRFQFLLDRAKLAGSRVDRASAFEECDALIAAASSPEQRVDALCISGLVSVELGELERAKQAYALAKSLRDELSSAARRTVDAASGHIALLATELAYCRADPAGALRHAKEAAAHLELAAQDGGPYASDLYVESLCQLGAALWNHGELEESYRTIVLAEQNLHRVRPESFPLRARVTTSLWKLRNHSLISSESWYTLTQRLEGLTKGFELASVSGSLLDGRDALIAIIQCHAVAGNDQEALEVAKFALTFTDQHPSPAVRGQVRVQIAMVLLSTRYYEHGFSLIDELPPNLLDGYHRAIVSYLKLERAVRKGEYLEALSLLDEGNEADRYPALVVRRQLLAASVAAALKQQGGARALIEATVPAAEDLGSAVLLRDACRLAAKITGDRRFKKRARELTRPVDT